MQTPSDWSIRTSFTSQNSQGVSSIF
jgi:hypothetical protein